MKDINSSHPSNSKSEDTSLDDLLSTLTDDFRRWLEPQLLAWHKAEVVKMAKEHIHDCLIEYAETGTVACFERAKATYESKRNEGMEALKDTKESL